MIQTYTEILTAICDEYDSYIAPKRIRRDNTNFLYLVFKAIAKGYERISNIYVLLRGKFDPEVCSDADLESIAKIAGTKKKQGNYSGLVVTIANTGSETVIVESGQYSYALDDSVNFLFTINTDIELSALQSVEVAAFSDQKGAYRVSDVLALPVTRVDEAAIHPDIRFSCADNELLQGSLDESNIDFRKRVLNDTTRQDTIKELELDIANLPYIFDCKLVFNQTQDAVDVGGVSVPPYHLLVNINGDPRKEIASIIAERNIYPTVEVDPAKVITYDSDVFIGGYYPVYYNTFSYIDFDVSLKYVYNPEIVAEATIVESISAALQKFKTTQKHEPFVTEDIFYDVVKSLYLPSFKLLDVKLLVDSLEVDYVSVPPTSIPRLVSIIHDGDTL